MSARITAIIVDDEQHARQALRTELQSYEQIEVIAECGNGVEAVKAVHDLKPQVLFLDIHMPRLDGFDVLELLGEDVPVTVFVTAHDEYAIRAFDNNALDYLLKPLNPKRLDQTIERLEQRLQTDDADTLVKIADDYRRSNAPLQRLLVRDRSDVHVIPVTDILYFEAADDYVAIHTESATHIKQERLQKIEELLDSKDFCRIHRSCLINLAFLSGIDTGSKDVKTAVMKNNKRLPISRSGYARLKIML